MYIPVEEISCSLLCDTLLGAGHGTHPWGLEESGPQKGDLGQNCGKMTKEQQQQQQAQQQPQPQLIWTVSLQSSACFFVVWCVYVHVVDFPFREFGIPGFWGGFKLHPWRQGFTKGPGRLFRVYMGMTFPTRLYGDYMGICHKPCNKDPY